MERVRHARHTWSRGVGNSSEVPVRRYEVFLITNSSIGETLGHDLAMIAQLYKETDPPVFIHR